MGTFVRNRVVQQLSWVEEEGELRANRRDALCELDGLLAQLEEINLRGASVPARIFIALRRRGVVFRADASVAEIIEAVFAAQEEYMRQPVVGKSMRYDYRRRLAS